MKKIVLSVLVAGSMLATSCKEAKKEAKEVTKETKDVADKAAEVAKEAATKAVTEAKETVGEVAEGAKEAVEGVAKEATSVLEGVKIPEFSNPEVTKNLTEYATYAKEYIAANGNLGKISAMAAKGKELLAKGKELASKLDATELAKYKSALAAIQAKMAPAR
ncbi:Probable lipoprotein precursor [Tenacibaculum maritimum]|uniref:hypothetical protein n=1 Tax=Tenacibaculum maritimum TaxID=107401 RepID=UPI0012E6A7C1|nr:hypothetical protein [Tenacibaculum maritimum]CAA0256574.1 Probable lipoprotein precursor [Tenacibaculum maritimum]